MVNVYGTDEFSKWYKELERRYRIAVARVVDLLELQGMALGYPYSSEIKGSKYAFRELRVRSRGSSLRVIYAFDPRRDAILIIGGDKTGRKRFYERIIPKAETTWEEYLEKEYSK